VRLNNPTKLFILIQMLDLLTTMVGIRYFGLTEGNVMFAGWGLGRMIVIKLFYTGIVSIVLQMPYDYEWLKWIPALVGLPPIPWNIYLIASVL